MQAQREAYGHVHDGIDEAQSVAPCTARDHRLAMPALLLPSIHVNAQAGCLPPAEDNGVCYLKSPINRF